MRQAARITLFVHDRDGRMETVPDLDVLHLLVRQTPLVTRNEDGSRTFVFDMLEPAETLSCMGVHSGIVSVEGVRQCCRALADTARALGLPLTAALADSAELVAEAEVMSGHPAQRQPA
jgi:hypothetical protein